MDQNNFKKILFIPEYDPENIYLKAHLSTNNSILFGKNEKKEPLSCFFLSTIILWFCSMSVLIIVKYVAKLSNFQKLSLKEFHGEFSLAEIRLPI